MKAQVFTVCNFSPPAEVQIYFSRNTWRSHQEIPGFSYWIYASVLKAILTWWWCIRRGCLKSMTVVAWKLGHSVENRKFGTPNLLFPALLLWELYMPRIKLLSKLYSGFLWFSTFCLGPSLEIFFLQKYMFCLTLSVANLSTRELSGKHLLQETARVFCCKRRPRMRSKDVKKDPFFLFT